MDKAIKTEITRLMETTGNMIICGVDEDGYPTAKAVFNRFRPAPWTFLISTNTSSIRVGQFLKNPKACVYFMDADTPRGLYGLSLTGTMEVLQDDASKLSIWSPGDEQYYPLGPTDPDYTVLRFTATRGNYYHGLHKVLFTTAEFEADTCP